MCQLTAPCLESQRPPRSRLRLRPSRLRLGHLRKLDGHCRICRLGSETLPRHSTCDSPALSWSSDKSVPSTVETQEAPDEWIEMDAIMASRSMTGVDETATASSGPSFSSATNGLGDATRMVLQFDETTGRQVSAENWADWVQAPDDDIHGWEAEFDKRNGCSAKCVEELEISSRKSLWRRLFRGNKTTP